MNKIVWLPIVAALWFFVSIDSFFTWNKYSFLFQVIPSMFVIAGSLSFRGCKNGMRTPQTMVVPLLLFFSYRLLQIHISSVGAFVIKLSDFLPLFFLMLWPKDYFERTYKIVRDVFLFYAIGSSIISILSLFGLLNGIPHFELAPQETLHVNSDAHYNIYGVFVVLTHTDTIWGLVRSCGMTLEPGHFSVYLGFIYLTERFLGKRINPLLVVGGLFTFSTVFFIIMFSTELVLFVSSENFAKKLKYFIFTPITIIFFLYIYAGLSSVNQESIMDKVYNRNLESVVNVMNNTGSLDEALNERASSANISLYNRMSSMEYLLGSETGLIKGEMLSDYRGMIVSVGILGICLSLVAYLSILSRTNRKHAIALFLAYLLVLVHRSWMLYNPYIYMFALMSVSTNPKAFIRRIPFAKKNKNHERENKIAAG